MKKVSKFILFALLIFSVFCITTVSSSAASGINSFGVYTAECENADAPGFVKWYLSYDGNYYLFLPADTDRSNLRIDFDASADIICNETALVKGESTSVFAEGDTFTLTCGEAAYTLKVLQAEKYGSIHITTESGNMDKVHADKSHKEPGDIIILDGEGNVQYEGVLDYIKGRGNSTWKLDKKPYNIKLDKKADLFGMGKHKSWCLLASANDPSYLRNPISYDMAYQLGIETTSDTFNINLYIDGKYAGLYTITEKVDLGENRVDIYDLEGETEDVNEKDLDEYPLAGAQNSREYGSIKYADIPNNPDDITGGYLLELEKIYRYPDEASGFITDIGQAVVVKTPEYASKAQVEYISNYYQEFENALYSPTGFNEQGKHYSDYIDIESLAKIYIILEFTSNFDGCSSSFYLSKDVGGKLVAGPAWDFDLSLGNGFENNLINHVPNTADPNILYIQTCFIGNHAEHKNALLAQAFSHEDFQKYVEVLWDTEFNTLYPTFRSNVELFGYEDVTSITMNAVLWNVFGTTDFTAIRSNYDLHAASVGNYMDARYPMLDKAYSHDTYFVKYDIGKYGKSLINDTTIYSAGMTATVQTPESNKSSVKFLYWSTEPDGKGKTYLPGDTITVTENVKLYANWSSSDTIESLLQRLFDFIRELMEKLSALLNSFFGNL